MNAISDIMHRQWQGSVKNAAHSVWPAITVLLMTTVCLAGKTWFCKDWSRRAPPRANASKAVTRTIILRNRRKMSASSAMKAAHHAHCLWASTIVLAVMIAPPIVSSRKIHPPSKSGPACRLVWMGTIKTKRAWSARNATGPAKAAEIAIPWKIAWAAGRKRTQEFTCSSSRRAMISDSASIGAKMAMGPTERIQATSYAKCATSAALLVQTPWTSWPVQAATHQAHNSNTCMCWMIHTSEKKSVDASRFAHQGRRPILSSQSPTFAGSATPVAWRASGPIWKPHAQAAIFKTRIATATCKHYLTVHTGGAKTNATNPTKFYPRLRGTIFVWNAMTPAKSAVSQP